MAGVFTHIHSVAMVIPGQPVRRANWLRPLLPDMGVSTAKEVFHGARLEFNQWDRSARESGAFQGSYASALFQFGLGPPQIMASGVLLMKVTLDIPSHPHPPSMLSPPTNSGCFSVRLMVLAVSHEGIVYELRSLEAYFCLIWWGRPLAPPPVEQRWLIGTQPHPAIDHPWAGSGARTKHFDVCRFGKSASWGDFFPFWMEYLS